MAATELSNQTDVTEGDVILEVIGLSKYFEWLKAVDDLNLTICSGELIGIIGPNGAGKTTLFNLLTGFLKPEKGSIIQYDGKNIAGWSPSKIVNRGIARTWQIVKPFKLLSTLENAYIPHIPKNLISRPSTLKNKATWSLITVDLAEKKNYPALILPHGDLKRLDFARSMAVQPRILLLDEPFSGLSVEEAFRVERVIKEANANGMTIIIVEHKLKILMRLVKKIFVLHQGQLIGTGTPKEIAKNKAVITAYLGKEADEYE